MELEFVFWLFWPLKKERSIKGRIIFYSIILGLALLSFSVAFILIAVGWESIVDLSVWPLPAILGALSLLRIVLDIIKLNKIRKTKDYVETQNKDEGVKT